MTILFSNYSLTQNDIIKDKDETFRNAYPSYINFPIQFILTFFLFIFFMKKNIIKKTFFFIIFRNDKCWVFSFFYIHNYFKDSLLLFYINKFKNRINSIYIFGKYIIIFIIYFTRILF